MWLSWAFQGKIAWNRFHAAFRFQKAWFYMIYKRFFKKIFKYGSIYIRLIVNFSAGAVYN